MDYIIESLLVGIYNVILYLFFSLFIKNLYILLLVVGFSKHFLGNILGIQTWYCNNGAQCLKSLPRGETYVANSIHLLRTSFGEAFAHLILGFILRDVLTKIYLFFSIGVILHISAEQLGIHNTFCRQSCEKKTTNK
jgi:O-antigen ligase